MKRFFFFILCLFAGYAAYGQDLIVTTSGDSLNCKITEVKTEAIFFRYDAGGNIVSLPMNMVASHKYDFYKGSRSTPAVAVSMRGRSEISLYAGSGLSGFGYEHLHGKRSPGFGGLFGIGYTWFVSGRWGIATGVEASLYREDYIPDNPGVSMTDVSDVNDSKLGFFRFECRYASYSEKQSALLLQIPVMAQFQTGRVFASAGLKFGIPISAKYEASYSELTTRGTRDGVDFPIDKDKGFYNFGEMSYTKDFNKTSFHVAGTLEAGGQWFLGKRTNLYAGFWCDVSMNNFGVDLVSNQKENILEYDSNVPGCLNYYSILDTNKRVSAWIFGLKVKLSFSL
jgi:hypothetical protein